MRIKETPVYQFDELSEAAKKKALERLCDINADDDEWADFLLDDFKSVLQTIGVDTSDHKYPITYSGFSSQGNGLAIHGGYRHAAGAMRKIKEEFPTWKELHSIIQDIVAIQKRYNYKITGDLRNGSLRSFRQELCTYDDTPARYLEDGEPLEKAFADLAHLFYECLEDAYYDLTSDEQIIETIRLNEYEFTADGRLA